MKKQLIVIVIVLAMLAAFTGTAVAAPLASGSATLVSVVFVPGKGPVYTFEVSGKYSKADLEGILQVQGGVSFDLHCAQVDSSTVKCTSSKKAAGKNVTLSWGGAVFSASVPVAPAESCYGIWDWEYAIPPTTWVNYGNHCQLRPAHEGDSIDWYNPVWDDTFTYVLMEGSPDCNFLALQSQDERAFYFPFC
jgi:hypothetical protein